jgi:predicted CXXCH cytochrome family protein
MALLKKKPAEVCLECHPDVPKKPHAVAGFSAKGHPLGLGAKAVKDLGRPGKPFYCGSCHVPHSSDGPRLLRFNAKSAMALCTNCHKM